MQRCVDCAADRCLTRDVVAACCECVAIRPCERRTAPFEQFSSTQMRSIVAAQAAQIAQLRSQHEGNAKRAQDAEELAAELVRNVRELQERALSQQDDIEENERHTV